MSATPDHPKGHPMTGMTPERLAEIRARAEAATEGPWWTTRNLRPATIFSGEGSDYNDAVADDAEPADATFIAHARTDVPELVAEIERLRELYSAMTPTTLLKTVV